MHRQFGEIGVSALQDDFLHGSIGTPEIYYFRLEAQTALHFERDLTRFDFKRSRQPVAASHHIADEFHFFVTDIAEPEGFRIALHDGCQIGEIDAVVAYLHLAAIDQVFHEAAQPETVEVVARIVRGGLGVHEWLRHFQ